MMLYIGLFIVLLVVALLFCEYFYRKDIDSPEQKLLKDFEKIKKEFEKRMKKQEKNMKKTDENLEKIWKILKDNDEKLRKIRDDLKE